MKKITTKQAARIIGASDDFVREAMRQGKLPIGTAVKMSNRWSYNISPKLLEEYIGAEAMKGAKE